MKVMRKILIAGLMLMSLAGTAMVSTSFAQAPPGIGPPPPPGIGPPPPPRFGPPPPPRFGPPPPTAAPEIDPASAGAALTLLAGGLIVLRGRKRE